MIIVAIAWIYVVLMMALTETSVTAGIATFLFYCVIPLSIVLYLMRSPLRKRQQRQKQHLLMANQISPASQANCDTDKQQATAVSSSQSGLNSDK